MNEDTETTLNRRRNVAILSSDEESEDLGLNRIHSAVDVNPTESNDFATLEKQTEEGENSTVVPSVTPMEVESNSDEVVNTSKVPATSALYVAFRWMNE